MTAWPHITVTEALAQQRVVEYCTMRHLPIFAIPNGGSRDVREAANLKKQGVKPGVPDLMIALACGGYHGLFIEMKRDSKSSVSVDQRMWISKLNENGYLAYICCGADDAILRIRHYLDLDKS